MLAVGPRISRTQFKRERKLRETAPAPWQRSHALALTLTLTLNRALTRALTLALALALALALTRR